MDIHSNIAGLLSNAAHASHRGQMAPEHHAPTSAHPDIRLRANQANNTLSIVDSGIGMTEQGLADIVRKGQQNITGGIGVTFYTASLVVRKVTARTNDGNGCQYKCESMEDGSFHISKDDNAEQLYSGTEIVLYLYENQSEYLEEEVIKDLVKKECGSIGYPIYLKVEKEPEQYEGDIQEVAEEWQVIHKPKAEAGAKEGVLNKPKKPYWKRLGKWMIDRLFACVIAHVALAAVGALDGDGNAFPF